jgi:hypothetical protein
LRENRFYDVSQSCFGVYREGLLEGDFLEGLVQMAPERHFESGVDVDRYEALLQMADLMVHHRGVPELLPELAKRLQQVASFEIASSSLYDPGKTGECTSGRARSEILLHAAPTTAKKRFGALGLGSSRRNAYHDDDLHLLRGVAELVALALENAMTREAFLEEKERLEKLLEVSTTLMSNMDVRQSLPAISALIRKVVRQDYVSVTLYEEANRCL